jgi:hypothetical protein
MPPRVKARQVQAWKDKIKAHEWAHSVEMTF